MAAMPVPTARFNPCGPVGVSAGLAESDLTWPLSRMVSTTETEAEEAPDGPGGPPLPEPGELRNCLFLPHSLDAVLHSRALTSLHGENMKRKTWKKNIYMLFGWLLFYPLIMICLLAYSNKKFFMLVSTLWIRVNHNLTDFFFHIRISLFYIITWSTSFNHRSMPSNDHLFVMSYTRSIPWAPRE